MFVSYKKYFYVHVVDKIQQFCKKQREQTKLPFQNLLIIFQSSQRQTQSEKTSIKYCEY